LRAQRQLIEWNVAARLVDPAFEIVGAFHVATLRRDQTENDVLVFWHEPKRRESSGARGVVLEEKTVEVELVEQNLRHRIVPALGGPVAAEITPANVHAYRHARRPVFDTLVDQFCIG